MNWYAADPLPVIKGNPYVVVLPEDGRTLASSNPAAGNEATALAFQSHQLRFFNSYDLPSCVLDNCFRISVSISSTTRFLRIIRISWLTEISKI